MDKSFASNLQYLLTINDVYINKSKTQLKSMYNFYIE